MTKLFENIGPEIDDYIEPFKSRKIFLNNEIAHLVYLEKSNNKKSVLYIHGFADYIHDVEKAKFFLKKKYNFYGIDLRNFGRSSNYSKNKYFINDIRDFFDEIDIAIEYILSKSDYLILMGFSMGGLITSLYTKYGKYRNKIKKLILISPLLNFDFKMSYNIYKNRFLSKLLEWFPSLNLKFNLNKFVKYSNSILTNSKNKFIKDFKFFNKNNFPFYLKNMKNFILYSNLINKGLDLQIPVLMLCSDESFNWEKYVATGGSDIVLDVEKMKKSALNISKNIKIKIIKDAGHKITHTKQEHVKKQTYDELSKWIN